MYLELGIGGLLLLVVVGGAVIYMMNSSSSSSTASTSSAVGSQTVVTKETTVQASRGPSVRPSEGTASSELTSTFRRLGLGRRKLQPWLLKHIPVRSPFLHPGIQALPQANPPLQQEQLQAAERRWRRRLPSLPPRLTRAPTLSYSTVAEITSLRIIAGHSSPRMILPKGQAQSLTAAPSLLYLLLTYLDSQAVNYISKDEAESAGLISTSSTSAIMGEFP